jgi:hypothetical protein
MPGDFTGRSCPENPPGFGAFGLAFSAARQAQPSNFMQFGRKLWYGWKLCGNCFVS